MSTGYVFAVQVGYDGPIRFGWTNDLDFHLPAMQRLAWEPLRYRNSVKAPPSLSDALQRMCAEDQIAQTEWFHATAEVEKVVFNLPLLASRVGATEMATGDPLPDLPTIEEQEQAVEALLPIAEAAYRKNYSPYSLAVHWRDRPVQTRPFLRIPHLIEAIGEYQKQDQRQRAIQGFCVFSRSMDSEDPEFLEWRRLRTIGTCPGGCHGHPL